MHHSHQLNAPRPGRAGSQLSIQGPTGSSVRQCLTIVARVSDLISSTVTGIVPNDGVRATDLGGRVDGPPAAAHQPIGFSAPNRIERRGVPVTL